MDDEAAAALERLRTYLQVYMRLEMQTMSVYTHLRALLTHSTKRAWRAVRHCSITS